MNTRCLLLSLALLLGTITAYSQHPIAHKIEVQPQDAFKSYELFTRQVDFSEADTSLRKELRDYQTLVLDRAAIQKLGVRRSENLKIPIPFKDDQWILKLTQADLLAPGFIARTSDGRTLSTEDNLYYWGIVEGAESHSSVSLAIGQNGLSAIISVGDQVYTVAKKGDGDRYLFFAENDIEIPKPFRCYVEDKHVVGKGNTDNQRALAAPDNCVNMYVEVDNDITNDKGEVGAMDYVLGAFAEVALLYQNESINLRVSEILVWTEPDPYTGTSTSTLLSQFRSNLGGVFNGDLAHLVGYDGGGGIAYVNVLCNKSSGVAYSDIHTSYNNVPTYSWTIMVLAHEIGHNLGSRHTHDCVWNGNNTAIDGCGPAAGYGNSCGGGPIPSEGGTIMSYCHLTSVGINFNLGFGPQPGDLIRNRVYNASCLTSCGTGPTIDLAITDISAPAGDLCEQIVTPIVTLTNYGSDPVTSALISSSVDGGPSSNFDWSGSLDPQTSVNVSLDPVNVSVGAHTFNAQVSVAGDENSANDAQSSSFTRLAEQTYYADSDGDGYGDPNQPIQDCGAPTGYVENNLDCDDTNPNIYPGATCNDNDACTVGDTIGPDCQCAGIFQDTDQDGVCDANDVCPGGDDSVDLNGNGVPDACECVEMTKPFHQNQLAFSGTGQAATSLGFNIGSRDVSFTISGIDAITNGRPESRYIDSVVVSYLDEDMNEIFFASYSGLQASTVQVNIPGVVNNITVSLQDGYDGQSPGQQVSLSDVLHCATDTPCDDADQDGVCDANDVCPGGDDNVDLNGNGIPDACEQVCANETIVDFQPAPLTHAGTGTSTSTVTLPVGASDVTFSITDLDARPKGKESSRYVEKVAIYYHNGTMEKLHASYQGDQVSSADIEIPGIVTYVRVELEDGYASGANGVALSVDLSSATACLDGARAVISQSAQGDMEMQVFPNPATDEVVVDFRQMVPEGELYIMDMLGNVLGVRQVKDLSLLALRLSDYQAGSGVLLLRMQLADGTYFTERIIKLR